MEAEGMTARAILHEYDHLEGKLFIDYISPIARTLLRGRLKKLAAAS
jgi:peptide deformylase